jgi:inositol transport system substrate-binding protein
MLVVSRRLFCGAATATVMMTPAFRAAFAADQLTIMTSVPSLEFPFFVHMMKELKAEAEKLGDITVVESDGQNSTTKQTADIEAAMVQKVNGIVISPKEVDAMAPALQQAVDVGIPVVTIDRRVDGVPDILAHVGADNVAGGEAQGRYIQEAFPNGARIVNLQGQPGDRPQQGRAQRAGRGGRQVQVHRRADGAVRPRQGPVGDREHPGRTRLAARRHRRRQ